MTGLPGRRGGAVTGLPGRRGGALTGPRVRSWALPALGVLTAVTLWWSATAMFGIRSFLLPAPPDIVAAFRQQPAYLLRELGATLTATVSGFGIAVVAGLLLAVVLTAFRALERAALPVLVALNSVPKVAVAPLLVVWLGFGMQPKIVLVVLICFFPVVVATMAGLTSTPAELSELSRSLSASVLQAYLKIRLPWALPQVFVGLKVAISLAVIGAVVAEISNPTQGLGAVIVLSGMSFDTPLAFAAIVLLAMLSTTLFYLVVGLERLLAPWARAVSG